MHGAISPEGWTGEAGPLCAPGKRRALSWLPFYAVSNENQTNCFFIFFYF